MKIEDMFTLQHQRGQRKLPKILSIMTSFTSTHNIMGDSDNSSGESEDGEPEELGKNSNKYIVNPLSIFQKLHIDTQKSSINCVQNRKNPNTGTESAEDSHRNLTYNVLRALYVQK